MIRERLLISICPLLFACGGHRDSDLPQVDTTDVYDSTKRTFEGQDTTNIFLHKSTSLIEFKHEMIPWPIGQKRVTRGTPIKIISEKRSADGREVDVVGSWISGYGEYRGNVKVDDNNVVTLFYWFDPEGESARHFAQHQITYRVRLSDTTKPTTYKIEELSR